HDWFPRPLPANVVIGPRGWLYSSFAFVHCRSRRPRAVRIGHDSGLNVGTFFELGGRGEGEIGKYCSIVGALILSGPRVVSDDRALVSHDVVFADSFAAAPRPESTTDAGLPPEPGLVSVAVRRNAWVGTRAVLLRGADLGEGAIGGAGSVVDFPVPAY